YRRRVAAAPRPLVPGRPTPCSGKGMRGVFDDPQVMSGAELAQLTKIDHRATDVDWNDADDVNYADAGEATALSLRELSLGVGEVDVQGRGIAVHEDRNRVHVADNLRGRRKRHCRHEDRATLRSFAEIERFDRQMQSGGRRIDGHRMLCAH